MKLSELYPKKFFFDVWREFEDESNDYRVAHSSSSVSDMLLVAYIFMIVALSLALQFYFGTQLACMKIVQFIDNPLSAELHPFLFWIVGWMKPEGQPLALYLSQNGTNQLFLLGYWALWRVIGFLALPAVFIFLHPRLRKMPMGLTFKGLKDHIWIYVALFLPVFLMVVTVSFTKEFSTYYPFYKNAHRSLWEFTTWEVLYIAQFLGLEFFFRGFMIQPLRKIMGSSVIFAMMIPYVMIHFGKPFPECIAAIGAGIILGTLALRTRSIWSGFLIHVSVALSMDLMAIWQIHWR